MYVHIFILFSELFSLDLKRKTSHIQCFWLCFCFLCFFFCFIYLFLNKFKKRPLTSFISFHFSTKLISIQKLETSFWCVQNGNNFSVVLKYKRESSFPSTILCYVGTFCKSEVQILFSNLILSNLK